MSSPFIHLFKTAKTYYCYDINTDHIVEVSKGAYEYLRNWKQKDEPNETSMILEDSVKSEIEYLSAKGYLKCTHVETVKHYATDYIDSYLENRMNQLVLQVTQKCNLRCSYCVYSGEYKNRQHSQIEMTFDTARRAVDYLYEHSSSADDIYIAFYGGEPLLMFPLIKKIIAYVDMEYKYRTVHYNLTTNGTLFNEDTVRYFIEHDVAVMFSLDGPANIHDIHRKFAGSKIGSFDRLMESVRLIYDMDEQYYHSHISFNTVLDPQNNFKCISDFISGDPLFIENMTRMSVINDNYTDREQEVSEAFTEEREYEYFKCFLGKIGKIGKEYTLQAMNNNMDDALRSFAHQDYMEMAELPRESHHGGPCIPGAKKLFVSAEGRFFPCERVSETSEVTCIGDLEHGVDKEKVLNILNIEKHTHEICRNCWAYRHCMICIGSVDDTEKISVKEMNRFCPKVRGTLEETLKDYCTLKELGYKFKEFS